MRCASFDTPPPQDLLDFYALRMCDNPVTTKYVPLIERPIPTFGVPYVDVADINARRVEAAASRGPVPQVTVTTISALVPLEPPQIVDGDQPERTVGRVDRRVPGAAVISETI